NVLVMGPWSHGGWARSDGDWMGTAYFGSKTSIYYGEHLELPVFNYFLNDKWEISQMKDINVFDTGVNDWRLFTGWSPPNSLVYQTEALPDDMTVAGSIKPEIFISSSGTDSDFIVKLIDVFPDDYQYPETGNKLPDGKPEYMKPPDTAAGCVFAPGGYQMLLR